MLFVRKKIGHPKWLFSPYKHLFYSPFHLIVGIVINLNGWVILATYWLHILGWLADPGVNLWLKCLACSTLVGWYNYDCWILILSKKNSFSYSFKQWYGTLWKKIVALLLSLDSLLFVKDKIRTFEVQHADDNGKCFSTSNYQRIYEDVSCAADQVLQLC
jgi:hypothetical protein